MGIQHFNENSKIFSQKIPSLVDEVQKICRDHTHLSFHKGIDININRQKRYGTCSSFIFIHISEFAHRQCFLYQMCYWRKSFVRQKGNFMPLSWLRLITQCARFFFPFVVFSTHHCTVHIKNWDTPKKLFVKWLFVRHIQCQGTTRYYMWCSTIQ